MKLKINLKKLLIDTQDSSDEQPAKKRKRDHPEDSAGISKPSSAAKKDRKKRDSEIAQGAAAATPPPHIKREASPDLLDISHGDDSPAPESLVSTPIDAKGKKGRRRKSGHARPYAPPRKKPLAKILAKLIDNISKRDDYMFFQKAVDTSLVPDYHNVVKEPMDLGTIASKEYTDLDTFKRDINLVFYNAKIYNKPETIFWKEADKLQSYSERVIEKERPLVMTAEEEETQAREGHSITEVGQSDDGDTVKDEMDEDVDVGDDEGFHIATKRDNSEAPSEGSSRRSTTPGARTKKRRYKKRTTGFQYNADGSIDADYVDDPFAILPKDEIAVPKINIEHGPRGREWSPATPTGEDRQHERERDATFLDYGAFSKVTDHHPTTAAEADYQFYLYGDERGEAYVRSLEEFIGAKQRLEDTDKLSDFELQPSLLRDGVGERLNGLTRGIYGLLCRMGRELYVGEHPGAQLSAPVNEESDKAASVPTEYGPVHFDTLIEQLRKWPEIRRAINDLESWSSGRLDLDVLTADHQNLLQTVDGAKVSQIKDVLLENAELITEITEFEGADEERNAKMETLRKALISVTKHVPLYDIYTKNVAQLNPSPRSTPPRR